MKYYLIAGEASGDLHGSNLMKALKEEDPGAEFRFFGGDLMQAAGGTLVKHYREMAFMGFLNVLLNLRTIGRNLEFCKKDLQEFHPDVLILIDYPGFNLRIARFAKQNNTKVFYYISPKVWAWKEYRVKKIKAFVDEMFTIFPFETEFYKKHGMDVHYVGNPLMDSISDFKKTALPRAAFLKKHHLDKRPVLALLSGSRAQEIKYTLPVMKEAVKGLPGYQVVVAGLHSVNRDLYDNLLKGTGIKLLFDATYDILNHAHTALVVSGTAALETALFHVPQAVLYKMEGGKTAHYIMQRVIKIKWVSLPNIILGKTAVKELLQKDMTVEKVRAELVQLLEDVEYRNKIFEDYQRLKEFMGKPGCSQRAARKMAAFLE